MTTTIFTGQSAPIEHPEDLLLGFRAAEKPEAEWRVGTEHEKLGFTRDGNLPLTYEGSNGIRTVLQAFVDDFGWAPVWEGENLIALLQGQASITLEPGGQLELSGAPLKTAHDTCEELSRHLSELKAISEGLGIRWLALGRNPTIPIGQIPWMPKERYSIMREYLPTRGELCLHMMLATGTVQVNLDYSSEADMARKMRVSTALAPVLTALYANSPFADGKATGFLSTRAHIWTATDPDRCGIVPAIFKGDFGYQDYVEYALDVPMFFIHREGHYLNYAGRSFREFIEKGLDGHRATQEDWNLHLTTLFPEARLKNIIELRMTDVGSARMICSLPALSRGLLYDNTALGEAEQLIRGLEAETVRGYLEAVTRDGLRAEILGRPVLEWARDLVDIAEAGLKRLDQKNSKGRDETIHLEPLWEIIESGRTQADLLVNLWNGEWQRTMEPLFSSDNFF